MILVAVFASKAAWRIIVRGVVGYLVFGVIVVSEQYVLIYPK